MTVFQGWECSSLFLRFQNDLQNKCKNDLALNYLLLYAVDMITLYDYFRSSASYRVRIVLNYKKLEYKTQEIHLVNNGGEQHSAIYKKINYQELVPSLELSDNTIMTQSLAILDYLENIHPEQSIYPKDKLKRAQAQSLAYLIACDVHPLNNLRVLNYLKDHFNISEDEKNGWYHHWIELGFASYEHNIKQYNTLENIPSENLKFSVNNQFTIADACLIPQVYNALRFNVDLEPYPNIHNIYQHCMSLPWVNTAQP